MRSPVLITPPASLPVTVDEAKRHIREIGTEQDAVIEGLIEAAVSHLDGWTGSLGRCLEEQTWRADYGSFCREMPIPLAPVTEIVSVTWRNEDGQLATVDSDDYLLKTEADGTSHLRFRNAYSFPAGLYESDPISVTFKAGYPEVGGESTVPSAIKVAIMLMVGHWFNNRETASADAMQEIPFGAEVLLSTFRKRRL
ncbi:head-tail connector protein [Devosia sp. Naph2]|uniref:head-tail connector protein n=1 Tax=Devosia polycyclovorans TaxID=3345148 RepID=UPI0035CFCCFD